ncbi:hypothetical protein AB0M29_35420 [Streptomyces sp. NPDC051976]|uniref:hypothetical protein n=1 Tax=Streptomyces sp. NPDC051976 TaxID=3154947 RepID=UPI003431DC08
MSLTPTHDSPGHEGTPPRTTAPSAPDPQTPHPVRWMLLACVPIVSVCVLSNTATLLYTVWQNDIGFSQSILMWIFVITLAGGIGLTFRCQASLPCCLG